MPTSLPHPTLYARDERSRYRTASPDQILATARHLIDQQVPDGTRMSTPGVVEDFLRIKLSSLEHEVFAALFLATDLRLIAYEEMFRGTLNSAQVFPREVVKAVLRHNAASIIIAHCHPSGNPQPSHADELLTRQLRDALALVDVSMLDHILVAKAQTTSFAALGLL